MTTESAKEITRDRIAAVMKRTRDKFLAVFLAGSLFLSGFVKPAVAAPCPDCYSWNGTGCVYDCRYGNCCDSDNCKYCAYEDGHYKCKYDCKSYCEGHCDGHGSCIYCDNDPYIDCCSKGQCCSWYDCKYCNGDGNCVSYCDPDLCQECDGNFHCKVCGDDPNKACCDGHCYDWRTQKCCYDDFFGNGYVCNKNETCCGDGSCALPCGQVELNNCSTSANFDCLNCQNLPWLCNNVDKLVYTDNHPYNCWSGCPGDCHDVDDVHCYTKYKCTADPDYLAVCAYVQVAPDEYDWKCVAGSPWDCYECIRDPTDPGEKHYTTSRKCE